MEWWSRLVGGTSTPKLPPAANNPQLRLARLKRVYHTILGLCNRPRQLANEQPLLEQLHGCLDRVAAVVREDGRAPAPHLCLQFAAANQIYTVIARAATVSQHGPVIHSAVGVLAALVDSEEEDFLSSAPFAKSLMWLVTKVTESRTMSIDVDTETAILELLFTIAAKIRLQPEILSYWFRSTARPELEDVFVKEKKSFVGITAKEDFPLCYLLVDRVHHEGRIGDFARTGLLYIFEATGRSIDLEEWVVSSDLPTLMASGLGALYSQLSRELSILHPDATLPAVLAMSDYSTTHPRATAESAFSERHRRDMATFLSYLAFWQDILDHCKSADVKQTLLDHFQILFLQQLLYPSLLQSSDTDAGSSVAVLTYMTAMLESLDYPDLMNMMLTYLLAIQDGALIVPTTPITPSKSPRSPTTLRRRQSLMLLAAPKDPENAVEPTLFNLTDLILNNVSSTNSQAVFAALRLSSTLLARQRIFAFGTLFKVQRVGRKALQRTAGALDIELDRFTELATSLHKHNGLNDTYSALVEDTRNSIEAQVPFNVQALQETHKQDKHDARIAGRYLLSPNDLFLKALIALLQTFFTNSVDVNLALTQSIIAIALCIEIRLDGWLALEPLSYSIVDELVTPEKRPWHTYLHDEDLSALSALRLAHRRPLWPEHDASMLYAELEDLAHKLDTVRTAVPNLDALLLGRKGMLQAATLDVPLSASRTSSLASSPTQASSLDGPKILEDHRASAQSGVGQAPTQASNTESSDQASLAASHASSSPGDQYSIRSSSLPTSRSIYRPPPAETANTTDVLMQIIEFPKARQDDGQAIDQPHDVEGNVNRQASLNHVLTNVVILQEFILELVAVMQVRAAVLGEEEIKLL